MDPRQSCSHSHLVCSSCLRAEELLHMTRDELWNIPPDQRGEDFKLMSDEVIRTLTRGFPATALAVGAYLTPDAEVKYYCAYCEQETETLSSNCTNPNCKYNKE